MSTVTYVIGADGQLEEVSSSSDEISSGVTYRDEIQALRGKSKRQLADMYMRGIITAEQFEGWCQGNAE